MEEGATMTEQDWGPNPHHVHSCRGCDEGVGCYEIDTKQQDVCDFDGYCDACSADIEAEYEETKKWMARS
jgi:hypothetical protein